MKRALLSLWFALTLLLVHAQKADNIPVAPDQDFVRAYIVVTSPGEVLYSSLGHACLRLVCADHQLDYVYTNEAEDVSHNVLRFFAGKLMMNVQAEKTDSYLDQLKSEGREVKQYELHLPIHVKQRLWQQMDQRLTQQERRYDYLNRGCAISVAHWIRMAIDRDSLTYGPWDKKYEQTRKELGAEHVTGWNLFLLATLTAGEAEKSNLPYPDRMVLPTQLVEIFQQATAYHVPLLDSEPEVLLAQTSQSRPFPISPLMVAVLFAVLMALNLWWRNRAILYVAWGFQFAAGLFIAYLVLLSDLPCTQWNWLLIPFNPLPVLCWRWRKYWSMPFAALCLLWIAVVLLLPHRVVIDAHYLLVFGIALAGMQSWPRILRMTTEFFS